MYSHDSSSWFLLFGVPLAFAIYVTVLLAVLWVATRVVRHAWYWESAMSRAKHQAQPGAPE
jgi:hypothetical protein